uniref:Uncharacterized protein n=1 Tax=Anguilla anguilla TaxID=7936 RepID=A0A0E9QUE5_ANGAN
MSCKDTLRDRYGYLKKLTAQIGRQ